MSGGSVDSGTARGRGSLFPTRGGIGRGAEMIKARDTANTYSILHQGHESDSEGSAPNTPTKPTTPALTSPSVPASPAQTDVPKRSRKEVEKMVTTLINDYLREEILTEALISFREIESEDTGVEFVSTAIKKACEITTKQMESLSTLFSYIATQQCLTSKDFETGTIASAPIVEDLSMDYPLASAHFGKLIGEAIKANLLVDAQLGLILEEFESPLLRSQVSGFILKSIPDPSAFHSVFSQL